MHYSTVQQLALEARHDRSLLVQVMAIADLEVLDLAHNDIEVCTRM